MPRRLPPPSPKSTKLSLVPADPQKEGEDSHGSAPPKKPGIAHLLTVEEMAQILRVSPKALYALVSRGHLPRECIHRLGRTLRFKALEVDAWISKGSRGTTKDGSP
jgi:excisionase family DNA binding protein